MLQGLHTCPGIRNTYLLRIKPVMNKVFVGANQEMIYNCVAEEFGNVHSFNAGNVGVISGRQVWNWVAICGGKTCQLCRTLRTEPGNRRETGSLEHRKWKRRRVSVWYCSLNLGSSGRSLSVTEISTACDGVIRLSACSAHVQPSD